MRKRNIIKLFLIFFVGCVVGWIYEELFYLLVDKKLVNSGFMYGPYLPVYGVGSLCIYLLLNKYKKHPSIIFFGALLITGIVEYITGYVLLAIYNRRWWDYTGLFMEIDGFVCLRSVISFALGALLLIYIALPLIDGIIKKVTIKKLNIITISISIIMLTDLLITLLIRY